MRVRISVDIFSLALPASERFLPMLQDHSSVECPFVSEEEM